MIVGVGTDIVEVARIARTMESTQGRFAQRILTPAERQAWEDEGQALHFLAKRWAVKEAFAKACGCGMRAPLTWQNLWIVHDGSGKPTLCVAPQVQNWLAEHKIARWHVSVSDEAHYVVAFAVVEER